MNTLIYSKRKNFNQQICLFDFMKSRPRPELTDEQQVLCEGPIIEKELYDAICSFQNGKSPGLDGIPVEVYRTFFVEIKEALPACYNFSFEVVQQSNSTKEGLISLLLKHDAAGQANDPVRLNKWRPLTLL